VPPTSPESTRPTYLPPPEEPSPFWQYVHGRVELGLRLTRFSLDTPTSGYFDEFGVYQNSFLGSINKLEEEQTSLPYPWLRYFPIPYAGVEVGYDRLRAITRKWTNPDDPNDSDGTLNLQGPQFTLLGRYPNQTWFTPYAGLGLVLYGSDFENEDWWHNGFGSYDDPNYAAWLAAGRPEWPNGGYQRTITISDTTAYFGTLGCAMHVWKGLEVDVQWRKLRADVDAHYTLSFFGTARDDRGWYVFPLDHSAWQASVKYAF
jgi:hypothetical protein